ncbi:tyrosine recombinase XerC [Streptomyces rishiriensis]|uniref:tyrosine recombinase XerC n=1 Tax=Streptomyces rishiriensis TaxID=68264 RepID=UPI0037B86C87
MHTFIDVLLGQGSTSSRARSPKTVENYVGAILGTLEAWIADGLTDPREITRKHIEDVLDQLRGDQARRLHTALRSFFRALKRERLVFRDPARSVSLTSSRSVPTALPSDRIAGLLDRLDDPRDRLMVALVAIYALLPGQLAHLRRTDLDRSKGQLRLRRAGRIDHVIYLDAFTLRLATAWEHHATGAGPKAPTPTSSSPATPPSTTAARPSAPAWSSCSSSESACQLAACAWTASSTRHATAPTPSG